MKLRNKKTGEIKDVRMSYKIDSAPIVVSETTKDDNGQSQGWPYHSLAELNEEWEDYKESKEDCVTDLLEWISDVGPILHNSGAEKAVEKLEAWKRLKDIGCSFDGWNVKTAGSEGDRLLINLYVKDCTECESLLDFLFGGENE